MPTERVEINPEIFKWARISAGYTLEEAAKRITTKLPEIENNQLKPTLKQVYDAAKIYRRPVQIFNFKEPPEDIRFPHDFRRDKTGTEKKLSRYNIFEIRKAHFRRKIALELSDYADEAPVNFIETAKLSDDVDSLASRIRKVVGIGIEEQINWRETQHKDALNNWIEAFESIGILVSQTAYHSSSTPDRYKHEIGGFCIKESLLPVIVVNREDYPNRRIFSLFHELTHLLLNTEAICDFRDYRDYNSHDQNVEVFCNKVAASVLVPKEIFVEEHHFQEKDFDDEWTDDELIQLSHKYSVSSFVILSRIFALGKISVDHFWKRWEELEIAFREFEEKNKKLLEAKKRKLKEDQKIFMGEPQPQKIIRTTSREFQRRVLLAYYHEDITSSDLASYIGVDIKHLDKIEKRVFEGKV